jgi:ferredoxin
MTKRIGIMSFSPTNTTKRICDAVACGMGVSDIEIFNVTLPKTRAAIIVKNVIDEKIDHLIVGAPVYSGKLPLQVLEVLKALHGNGKEATAIVVYGNRDYGIALYNMVELLSEKEFRIAAAGAFIGQHSYSDIVPVALGRPDVSDLENARQLGIKSLQVSKYLSLKDIPVQSDMHSKSKGYTALKPLHDEKLCIQCGKCAKKCPVGLLCSDTGRYLNLKAKQQCIGCMACVNACMQKAKVTKVNPIVKLIMKIILRRASRERKEPLILLA